MADLNIDPVLGYDPEDVGNGCYTNRFKRVSKRELDKAIKFMSQRCPDLKFELVNNPTMGESSTVAGGKFLPLNIKISRLNPDQTVTEEKFDATLFVRMFPITWCGIANIFYEGAGANIYLELPE